MISKCSCSKCICLCRSYDFDLLFILGNKNTYSMIFLHGIFPLLADNSNNCYGATDLAILKKSFSFHCPYQCYLLYFQILIAIVHKFNGPKCTMHIERNSLFCALQVGKIMEPRDPIGRACTCFWDLFTKHAETTFLLWKMEIDLFFIKRFTWLLLIRFIAQVFMK